MDDIHLYRPPPDPLEQAIEFLSHAFPLALNAILFSILVTTLIATVILVVVVGFRSTTKSYQRRSRLQMASRSRNYALRGTADMILAFIRLALVAAITLGTSPEVQHAWHEFREKRRQRKLDQESRGPPLDPPQQRQLNSPRPPAEPTQ